MSVLMHLSVSLHFHRWDINSPGKSPVPKELGCLWRSNQRSEASCAGKGAEKYRQPASEGERPVARPEEKAVVPAACTEKPGSRSGV